MTLLSYGRTIHFSRCDGRDSGPEPRPKQGLGGSSGLLLARPSSAGWSVLRAVRGVAGGSVDPNMPVLADLQILQSLIRRARPC